MNRLSRIVHNHSYLFALLLLGTLVAINLALQPNFLQPRVLGGNLRVLLPLMILAMGQAVVIIGGGIDLSVGAIVSMVNTIFVALITQDATGGDITLAVFVGCGAGMLAGALNGICVAFLRLQPIVTTYATSFVFAGLALIILPRPGGGIPRELTSFYRSAPLDLPLGVYVIAGLLILWAALRSTRYIQYLYAIGSKTEAAYTTGLPVSLVRFGSYVLAGLFCALAALALTLSIGSGNPRIGEGMTLDSIVAVVLGGTRLSGGQGGVTGAIIGVAILGMIRNVISFANVPTWYQTLADALVILLALAGPGLAQLLRRRKG